MRQTAKFRLGLPRPYPLDYMVGYARTDIKTNLLMSKVYWLRWRTMQDWARMWREAADEAKML